LRKGSSNKFGGLASRGSDDYFKTYDPQEEDDMEAVITYLELMNDFVKANL
jgi:hypothetical protein